MLIELAKLRDYADITALLIESGVLVEVVPDHIGDCLVLRSGRNLVGVAQMRCVADTALGLCLVVRPGFRRMGLGKRLGQAMIEHCHLRGVQRLYVYSDTAPFYFRSLGFQPAVSDLVPETVSGLLDELRGGMPIQQSHLLEFQLEVAALQSAG